MAEADIAVGQPLGKTRTPAGFERKRIVINTRYTGRREVEAFVFGHMAVYRSIDDWQPTWTVSHAATGFAAFFTPTLVTAVKYARLLNGATDWEKIGFKAGKITGWTKTRKLAVAKVILPVRPDLAERFPSLSATA